MKANHWMSFALAAVVVALTGCVKQPPAEPAAPPAAEEQSPSGAPQETPAATLDLKRVLGLWEFRDFSCPTKCDAAHSENHPHFAARVVDGEEDIVSQGDMIRIKKTRKRGKDFQAFAILLNDAKSRSIKADWCGYDEGKTMLICQFSRMPHAAGHAGGGTCGEEAGEKFCMHWIRIVPSGSANAPEITVDLYNKNPCNGEDCSKPNLEPRHLGSGHGDPP